MDSILHYFFCFTFVFEFKSLLNHTSGILPSSFACRHKKKCHILLFTDQNKQIHTKNTRYFKKYSHSSPFSPPKTQRLSLDRRPNHGYFFPTSVHSQEVPAPRESRGHPRPQCRPLEFRNANAAPHVPGELTMSLLVRISCERNRIYCTVFKRIS